MFKMDRGFGFIQADDGGADVVVHARDFARSGIALDTVQRGDIFEFDFGKTGTADRTPRTSGASWTRWRHDLM
jgi:cold shock CspA family protein